MHLLRAPHCPGLGPGLCGRLPHTLPHLRRPRRSRRRDRPQGQRQPHNRLEARGRDATPRRVHRPCQSLAASRGRWGAGRHPRVNAGGTWSGLWPVHTSGRTATMNPAVHPLLEAPWGAIIGVYFMLVGLATGVTLVAYWVYPEDARAQVRYAWVTTWMAFLSLVAGSVLLVVDLEQPARFHLMVASFSNLGSPMSIGAKLIAAKLFLLAVYLYLLARRRGAVAAGDLSLTGSATRALFSTVPAALAVVSVALAVYPAVLLARTWSSPLAHTPAAGVLLLSTALLMGTAVAL